MLVIIDGLDGSGKSTQANLLLKSIQLMNKTVYLRIHPENDNWFGKKARAFLLCKGKSAHFASALFYMIDVIHSILFYSWRTTDFVDFVRYLMGTAYLPRPVDIVGYLFFSSFVPKTRYMFFLDVDPTEASIRIRKNRKEIEVFENVSSLKITRDKALYLTRFDDWVIIDSNKSPDLVASKLRRYLLLGDKTGLRKEQDNRLF
jgi:dTMP kinase